MNKLDSLTKEQFRIRNGTATKLVPSEEESDSIYTLSITPEDNGEITVVLPKGAVTSKRFLTSLKQSAASDPLTVTYSPPPAPPPTVSLRGPAQVSGQFEIAVIVSEPITGLDMSDFIIGNGKAVRLEAEDDHYALTVDPGSSGEVLISLPEARVTNATGRPNTASNQLSVVNMVGPGPDITAKASLKTPNLTVSEPFDVTVSFSEEVTGLELSDFETSPEGIVSGLTGSGTSYEVTVSPPTGDQGDVTIRLPADCVITTQGAGNLASNVLSVSYDIITTPTVVLESSQKPVSGPFEVAIRFSEPVVGLAPESFLVTNGTAAELNGSGVDYTLSVTPDRRGMVTVELPAGSVRDPVGTQNLVSNQIEIDYNPESRASYLLPALGLLGLPLLFMGGMRLWWRRKAQLFLINRPTSEKPELHRITVRGLDNEVLPPVLFLRIAQQFRRRIDTPSGELDIGRTVMESVRRRGWFTPVYGQRQIPPEYIVLIDRATRSDYQAKIYEAMVEHLAGNGVFLKAFSFDRDPRLCYPLDHEGPAVSLHALAARHHEDRLVIFSEGDGMLDPVTGELGPWTDDFHRWKDRALLTPTSAGTWMREELGRLFRILPATPSDLAEVARGFARGEAKAAMPVDAAEESATLDALHDWRVCPQRWLSRGAPEAEEIDDLLVSLRSYLGESGYYWMSACAVYPELHWNLTVYLGHTLAVSQNDPHEKLLSFTRLAALARLPWFRHGHMPDWLRERLITDLTKWQEREVRTVLQELFVTAVDGASDGFELEIAREHKKTMARLAAPLLARLRRTEPDGSPLRDHVFADFLTGKHPNRLAVRVPKAIGDLVQGAREFGSDLALRGSRERWSAEKGWPALGGGGNNRVCRSPLAISPLFHHQATSAQPSKDSRQPRGD